MPLVDDDSPQVRFPPPLIFVGCLVLGGLVGRALEWPVLAGVWPETLGWALVVLGSVFIGAALGWFYSAGTNPEPWKRDSALVTKGFYRITRNPMYLGMAFASFGIALVYGSFGAMIGAAAAVLLVDRFVIAREERHLAKVFGEDYAAYRKRVRRWI
jgi:protein-S-isoprenylcysteine O-methyltransferase Ste14